MKLNECQTIASHYFMFSLYSCMVSKSTHEQKQIRITTRQNVKATLINYDHRYNNGNRSRMKIN